MGRWGFANKPFKAQTIQNQSLPPKSFIHPVTHLHCAYSVFIYDICIPGCVWLLLFTNCSQLLTCLVSPPLLLFSTVLYIFTHSSDHDALFCFVAHLIFANSSQQLTHLNTEEAASFGKNCNTCMSYHRGKKCNFCYLIQDL